MKKVWCVLLAVLLLFSSTEVAFASENQEEEEASYTTESMKASDLGPTGSVEFQFSELQLEAAQANKEQAEEYMKKVEALQEESRLLSGFISTARQLQADAEAGKETGLPSEIAEYMKEHKLSYDTAASYDKEQWDDVINVLLNRLEELMTQSQQEMEMAQNFMGQYNACLQNASSTITTESSVSRGQSMYGDSSVGLTVTALVIGLILGCCMTLVVQKAGKGKGKA